jgi:predicted porin
MKKSLIALAALAAAGVASAQSSVTLFGIVDATYNNTRADAATGGNLKVSRLTNSGYNSSRLGFRGTEDLGGGMSAGFWLEAGLTNDDGTGAASNVNNQRIPAFAAATGANAPVRAGTQGLTFNRRSTVSLAGNWGEVRLGRDYVPAFWNHTVFDPFGTNGVGQVSNLSLSLGTTLGIATTVRASNSIGYFLPGNLGGFYGQLMYAFGENTEPLAAAAVAAGIEKNDGRHVGARFGWASGPFNVAYGYGETKANGSLTLGAATLGIPAGFTDGKYRNQNLAGQWDFGVAKLLAQWNEEKVKTSIGDAKNRTYMIGTLVPVGAGEIRASYTWGKADDDVMKGKQLAIGYVHNLSKRTAVYATYSALNNDGSVAALNYSMSGLVSTAVGGDSRGYDIGIRHSF